MTAVRIATGYDEVAVLALWTAARAADGRSPSDACRTRVRTKLRAPAALVLLAEDLAGQPQGMLLAELGRDQDGAGPVTPGLLHLSMLFVAPHHQRAGVGQVLLGRLTSRYPWVRGWAGAGDHTLSRCLLAAHFTPTGREHGAAPATFRQQWEHLPRTAAPRVAPPP